MTPAQETKVLTTLIKRLDQPDGSIFGNQFFYLALWFMLAILFLVMFRLTSQDLLIVIAVFIGAVFAWIFFYAIALNQWSVIRPHIDRVRIEARLRELKT